MQLWLKPSLSFDDCYFQVSYWNTKVSKLLWQGIKVARLRYYVLFITEFFLIFKYHRTSKKIGKIVTNGYGRLGIFWAVLRNLIDLITILTFMSSSTSCASVEAAAAPLPNFIAFTASKAKSAYHFNPGMKKYHSLHGHVTQLLWNS